MSTSLLSGNTRCLKYGLRVPCPILESVMSSTSPGSFYWTTVFRNWGLGTMDAHCSGGLIASRPLGRLRYVIYVCQNWHMMYSNIHPKLPMTSLWYLWLQSSTTGIWLLLTPSNRANPGSYYWTSIYSPSHPQWACKQFPPWERNVPSRVECLCPVPFVFSLIVSSQNMIFQSHSFSHNLRVCI